MSWPFTFATATSPLQASVWDTMFAAVATVSAIPCNASGTNVIALTPMTNAPDLASYKSLQLLSFIAPATSTSLVRASFGSLAQFNVYGLDGATQVGAAGIIGGQPYFLMFSQTLNAGSGGFYLLSFSTGQSVPPGSGNYYFGAPTTDPPGWYVCNGRAVSRAIDAPLFAAIGTTYGIGDGSTTFNIPNPQGYFMRVLDNGAGIDPGRLIGSTQLDQIQDHTHPFATGVDGANASSGSAVNAGAAGANTGVPNSGNHGAETRPKNFAAPMIIKR